LRAHLLAPSLVRAAEPAFGSVLVVDDDDDVRGLIAVILENSGFDTVQAANGELALELARQEEPRIAVLDVHLPGISGYEVCRSLRAAYGEEMVIVIVSGERIESFDRVAGLLLGADDYLTKPFATDELLVRIRRLSRRLTPAARSLATRLTRRELEVLRLLAVGISRDEIASRMVISPKTVATHIEHIFLKLGVQTSAQAVALAYREALVSETGTTGSLASIQSVVPNQLPSAPRLYRVKAPIPSIAPARSSAPLVRLAAATARTEAVDDPLDAAARFAVTIRPAAST